MPLRSAAISRQHSHRLFSPQIVAPSRSCIVVSRAQSIVKVQRRLHFFLRRVRLHVRTMATAQVNDILIVYIAVI